MFSLASLSVLALAASAVSGLAIPRAPAAAAPAGWSNSLEDYGVYHTRYLAISCQTQHDTSFFDRCCHPVQKGSQPDPSCATSDSGADDDEDCEDDDEPTTEAPQPTVAAPKPTAAAPKPTTTATPAPKPTPAAPKPAPAPAPEPAKENNGPQGGIGGGFATFFFQNGVAGACGKVHGDGELIAAMDSRRYGNTSVKSSLCGKRVQITNPKNKKSVTVTVADACPTCENSNSIDLSRGAFEKIATLEEGMVPIVWNFV